MENNLAVNFEIQNNELDAEFDLAEIQNFDAEFVVRFAYVGYIPKR